MSISNITPGILVAEREIGRLLATYVHHLDDGKFAEIAQLMKHAEFKVLTNTARGDHEVERFLNAGVQRHDDGTPRTWHSLSNIMIDVDTEGTTASSVSYFVVLQELEGFPLQAICTGRYHDTFELRNGEWLFRSREVKPRLFGDLKHHVVSPAEVPATAVGSR
jgi:3-phenylpropionate/cinnamic acid dioxygenase small subunit